MQLPLPGQDEHCLGPDFLGQVWWPKKLPAVQIQESEGHALIASCDLSASGGYKKFSSFASVDAFVSYLERRQAAGDLNHYECLQADKPSKFYVDIDYKVAEKNDEDFRERFEHCEIVLRGFLERVLLVPLDAINFQVATAHGKGGCLYKYSAHMCMPGFCLKDASVRGELNRALQTFVRKPPEELRRSCEFLFYQFLKNGALVDDCVIDKSVYSSFQNWRTLYSEKKGSDRPLEPAPGSSPHIRDHLVGLYDPADRAAVMELDGKLLSDYNWRENPSTARASGSVAARAIRATYVERGDVLRPLTDVEKERLLTRYQKDHPGAVLLRAQAVGEDLFTLHFGVQTPYCWIAGRPHTSSGNACGYLVYSRKTPSRASYRCHSHSCR